MKTSNIFEPIPSDMAAEVFEQLVRAENVRIERIISKGHTSPDCGWYEQDENEWVMIIDGNATIEFEDGPPVTLGKGDHLNIPANCKHKVTWSDPNHITIWLAVFYG